MCFMSLPIILNIINIISKFIIDDVIILIHILVIDLVNGLMMY